MGGGNVVKTLTDVALNAGTAGLYSAGKAVDKAARTGKILAAAADATANQGVGGGIITPALGTKKSLMVQAAVAGGAGAAGASGLGTAAGITPGEALLGSTALTAAGTAYSATANKPPKLPGAPEPAKIDQAAIDAANSVQSADAEARRRRAAKRQSSVLSAFNGSSQVGVSPATLQPAAPRRSVLG